MAPAPASDGASVDGGTLDADALDTSAITRRLDLLGIDEADRAQCAGLLARPASADVRQAMSRLETRLGTFTAKPAGDEGLSEGVWIEAILRFAPRVVQWHGRHGISPADSALILADIGRQMAIHRRVHGTFGLETWAWLTLQLAGNMFQLGRLQFHLVANQERDGWVLDIHIPELTGPQAGLAPDAVDSSLALAQVFFATHFPDKPVTTTTCSSWMLDPYLSRVLPHGNIAAFARRFVLDRCTDAPADAVYFTFRKRGLEDLDVLPRETSLQRAVLERIDDGGTWQLGHGRLELPPAE
ncbi:acyltransferase domain-containing protein [Pseudarthrobacter sp. J75]|uniref:acyltransferase domain-containing protein n=1 Tax=unclassified Pseudarthrobacter TaxID=2647000 RepID=UPI002E7FD22E|nr:MULTISPECIES: acyltransferase domain-containing protein [unclassified Pseudarthrobacter]MEE2522928.1 acyltransferase domain-containing protein [Pseudarthrobacter sp. J47]MEE2529478.1 acyltransferase domain-containing protein [Pseudarthrobacter sp. J75]